MANKKLSIAIPSRNEIFLQRTIQDVLEKATGDIEVFPILDGYEPPPNELVDDPRVRYIRLPQQRYTQKRHGINHMVDICNGKYVMSLDAHCMMAKGFDEVLIKDLEENEVALPRRNRLDAENWCIQKQSDDRPQLIMNTLCILQNSILKAFMVLNGMRGLISVGISK